MKDNLTQQSSFKEVFFNRKIDRLFSLDLLKAISITAVVSFHSNLVPREAYIDNALPLDILFSPLKFCVPVFLTIYFLLFEKGLLQQTNSIWFVIKKRLMRLLTPTIFWFSITGLLKLSDKKTLLEIIGSSLNGTIFSGAYYLVILFQLIPVFIVLRVGFRQPRNIIVTILVQCLIFVGIYATPSLPYHDQILEVLRTIHRPLFIYWIVYIALGVLFWNNWSSLVQVSTKISIRIKIVLLISYSLIQMSEFYLSFLRFEGEIPPFDYIMFSCILSVFVMLLCFASIQENQLPLWLIKLISTLSKYSLGIFCINGILARLLAKLGIYFFSAATFSLSEVLIIKLISWVFLLFISLLLSISLDRIGLKAVVR